MAAMSSLNAKTEVLKQDARGRVRVSAQRREALLDKFERSGASGVKFGRLTGIKYATFANWVLQRRKRRAAVGAERNGAAGFNDAAARPGPLRLLEAVPSMTNWQVKDLSPRLGRRRNSKSLYAPQHRFQSIAGSDIYASGSEPPPHRVKKRSGGRIQ